MDRQTINEAFEQGGADVDVLYSTSDDTIHLSSIGAIAHIREQNLKDEKIETWFKNEAEAALRASMREETPLERMVTVTDFVKRTRFARLPEPLYQEYLDVCARFNKTPVTESSFDFVVERVFNFYNKVPAIGSGIPILLQQETIVMATVIRNYGYHKLAIYHDYLILTCPTNIQLMAYSITELFKGIIPQPTKQTNNESIPSKQ